MKSPAIGAEEGRPAPRWLRDVMTPSSRIRYLVWRALGVPDALTVRLSSGETLIIRRQPAGDLDVAYEVFVLNLYRSPRPIDPRSVRRIVDVGANVGYSVTYLGQRYPSADIDAFEPHPVHVAQLHQNLHANSLTRRVTVHPVAAGTGPGVAWLADAGSSSRVTSDMEPGACRIGMVDFFEAVGEKPIDFLKMDCEGGEYELLMSPQFAELNVTVLALEWHATEERPSADREICARLQCLGWSLERGPDNEASSIRAGMLWGYQDRRPRKTT